MASTAHADAQTMGDDAAADAADIEVPEYDEDESEAFHGPELLREVELEEHEDFPTWPEPQIEAMESQWAVSGYTQLGAVPGSQTQAKAVVRPLAFDPLPEQIAMGKQAGTCRSCSRARAKLTEHAKASAHSRCRWRRMSVKPDILQILAGDACAITQSIGAFTVGA